MRCVPVCLVVSTFCLASSHVRGQAPTAADLAWVPADAPGFVALRVADLWRHDSTKELRELLAKAQVDVEKEIETSIGLRLSEIERVILVVPPPGKEPVFVVTTTRPALEKLLKASAASKKKHGDHTYYEAEDMDLALYPAGERLVVLGQTKSVLELLDRAGQKKAEGPLSESLKLAVEKAPLLACLNLTTWAKELRHGLPPQLAAVSPLLNAQPAVLTLVSGADTNVSLRLTFANEDQAKERAKVLAVTFDLARQLVPVGRTELAKVGTQGDAQDGFAKWLVAPLQLFLDKAEEALKNAKVEVRGRDVRARLDLKVNVGTLAAVLALLGNAALK